MSVAFADTGLAAACLDDASGPKKMRADSAEFPAEDQPPREDAGAADQREHQPPRVGAAVAAASSTGGRALDIARAFRSTIPKKFETAIL